MDPMSAAVAPGGSSAIASLEKLAASIERLVHRRTSGQIRDLRVEVSQESVRLQGRCATFYCKQLAQQAVMDTMDVNGNSTLTNEIEVG
jgi:osmotically-inducible protein OsmY